MLFIIGGSGLKNSAFAREPINNEMNPDVLIPKPNFVRPPLWSINQTTQIRLIWQRQAHWQIITSQTSCSNPKKCSKIDILKKRFFVQTSKPAFGFFKLSSPNALKKDES